MTRCCDQHYFYDVSVSQKEGLQTLGDSLVLYCASLLRMILESLARAHERLRVQAIRDFPQKLDREINAPLLLNELFDPHCLLHIFNEDNILNN